MISFEFHLEKWHEKTLETVAALGFSGPISFSVLLVGCGGRTRTYDLRVMSCARKEQIGAKCGVFTEI